MPLPLVSQAVLSDGNGVDVCRMAKALAHPPLVIVTPTTAEQVPAALKAGCNAVLLRPFSPNLLCARIGRLRQLSHRAVTMHRAVHREDIAVNVYLSNDASVTTNHLWNEIVCPRCNRRGATGFDFVSHRRMWCACLSCDHVWIARRLE
jgi:DNA-binding response OmpR family regulator